jgi:hypothetical protein
MKEGDVNWQTQLRNYGYAHFPGLTPSSLAASALEAIERDTRDNYDSSRQVEYDNRSYCPDIVGDPPIMDLLSKSPIIDIVDEALGLDNVEWGKGQIAIRRSRNSPVEIPPEPHIDGFASGLNGLEEGKVYNQTALVGVFLTPVLRPFAGNFTVWPGSHYVYESYFRARGSRAMREPMPAPEIGQPVQLMCGVGDAVFCHYLLGHSAAVNTAEIDRVAVYFRIYLRDIEERRWSCLTNVWEGWKI